MDKSGTKNYRRKSAWFYLALFLFLAGNSFATAFASHSFSHILIGIGFAIFGFTYFKNPIKLNKPVTEIITDHEVGVTKENLLLDFIAIVLIIVGHLLHWTIDL